MSPEEVRSFRLTRVLVAERVNRSVASAAEYLEEAGCSVLRAADGEEALRHLRSGDPEVVLLDVATPRLNAYQLCERIKTHPTTRHIPVVLMVSEEATDDQLRGYEVGADDLLRQPLNRVELLARVQSLVRLKRLSEQSQASEQVIFSLAKIIERKDASGRGDSEGLSHYVDLLGRKVGLSAEDLEALHVGSLLHDVGKIVVREEVLHKPGRLSGEELAEIKLHPEVGEQICGALSCADHVLPIIRYHRERWDGGGYPDGLRGEQIPLMARILAIADAYHAMLSARPYRPAWSVEEARAHLRAGAGTQWDPDLVEQFLGALEEKDCNTSASGVA